MSVCKLGEKPPKSHNFATGNDAIVHAASAACTFEAFPVRKVVRFRRVFSLSFTLSQRTLPKPCRFSHSSTPSVMSRIDFMLTQQEKSWQPGQSIYDGFLHRKKNFFTQKKKGTFLPPESQHFLDLERESLPRALQDSYVRMWCPTVSSWPLLPVGCRLWLLHSFEIRPLGKN